MAECNNTLRRARRPIRFDRLSFIRCICSLDKEYISGRYYLACYMIMPCGAAISSHLISSYLRRYWHARLFTAWPEFEALSSVPCFQAWPND